MSPEVEIPLNPLRPATLSDLIDDVFLKHDLNIYNFLIRINREMKAQGIQFTRQPRLNFDCITDGPFEIDESSLPNGRLNVLDLETAIELYTRCISCSSPTATSGAPATPSSSTRPSPSTARS